MYQSLLFVTHTNEDINFVSCPDNNTMLSILLFYIHLGVCYSFRAIYVMETHRSLMKARSHGEMTKPTYICSSGTLIWLFNRLEEMTESTRIISYSFWIVKIGPVIAVYIGPHGRLARQRCLGVKGSIVHIWSPKAFTWLFNRGNRASRLQDKFITHFVPLGPIKIVEKGPRRSI